MKKKKIRQRNLGELMAGILPAPAVSTPPTPPATAHNSASQAKATPAAAPVVTGKASEESSEKPKFPSLRKTPSFSVKSALAGRVSEAIPTPPPPANLDRQASVDIVEEEEEVLDSVIEEVELNSKNLEIAWERFASYIKKNRPRIGYTLEAQKPILIDDNSIAFDVVNNHQKEDLMGIYNELIHFLRKSLSSPMLELEFNVVEGDSSSARPYTIEEKFKSLVVKNPALLVLKQTLGLDFE